MQTWLFIMLFVASTPPVLVVLRNVSGWAALARVYGSQQPSLGPYVRFRVTERFGLALLAAQPLAK